MISREVSERDLAGQLVIGALREHDAAVQARDLARRALYVGNVSRTLTESLDEAATRNAVRRVTLLRQGIWSFVELVEDDGTLHRLPALHPQPAKRAMADSLERSWPVSSLDADASVQVLTRKSGAALLTALHDPESLHALTDIGFGSLLSVPLVLRRVRTGTLFFVSPAVQPRFAEEEIALAREIASFCVMALEKARLYTEAIALRKRADVANVAKSAFLATMSHELRTPLNAIGGFVELVVLELYGPVTEAQREALGRVKVNQQHLLGLINDVLDFARIEAGHTSYAVEDVPLATVRDDVLAMLEQDAAARRLTLLAPPCVDVHARADAHRVLQIVVNLVSNAVKYSPEGAGPISVTCGVEGTNVFLRVTDCGPGIPPAERSRVFKPFVQLASGLSNRKGGVGLGLAISRELAVGMGGDITVSASESGGAVFTLTLPRAPATD